MKWTNDGWNFETATYQKIDARRNMSDYTGVPKIDALFAVANKRINRHGNLDHTTTLEDGDNVFDRT